MVTVLVLVSDLQTRGRLALELRGQGLGVLSCASVEEGQELLSSLRVHAAIVSGEEPGQVERLLGVPAIGVEGRDGAALARIVQGRLSSTPP